MNVNLLSHTPEPEKTIAMAAKLCYSPSSIGELKDAVEGEDQGKFINKIIEMGHTSVLEHANFTFGVEGISRATSHQLVRHRLASYSQQSQRYVEADDNFEYVTPDSIQENKKHKKRYDDTIKLMGHSYEVLIAAGIPSEDARYLLPNAAATKIIITMNARELVHFFSIRCCERAQWEIRDMATRMLKIARDTVPSVFNASGPSCTRGKCGEGKMTCGKTVEIKEKFKTLCKEETNVR